MPLDVAPDIYDSRFVRQLFDEMSATYGTVNVISSFGFCVRWRRQCLEQVPVPTGGTVVDLMTGMGELCPRLARRIGHAGQIIGVDISPQMCRLARRQMNRYGSVEILEGDALQLPLPENSADVVVSSFGLKTFSPEQIRILAQQVHRVLKPGGVFAFMEISVPRAALLRVPYMFYLNRLIPLIGRAFMGNPENYRMLGIYTARFGDCRHAQSAFTALGLRTTFRSLFFGCATGIYGQKPEDGVPQPAGSRSRIGTTA